MKALLVLFLGIGLSAYASDVEKPVNNNGTQNIQICKPGEPKTKVVYMTYKQQARIKKLEEENARLRRALGKKPKVKVVEKVKYKTKVKVKKYVRTVDNTRKNAVSLIVPYAPTELVTSQSGNTFTAETDRELDAGLMYQRDFDSIRGTVGATLNGTIMLGVGVGF